MQPLKLSPLSDWVSYHRLAISMQLAARSNLIKKAHPHIHTKAYII